MSQLYTIGHSAHPVNYFLSLLFKYKINCVVDVRSVPYSKFSSQYNMNEIKALLAQKGIYYIFMGEEFGARRSDSLLYNSEGYLDFEKVVSSTTFKKGVVRIKNGLNKGYSIAFMCTEKDPINCHRNILVARTFHEQNYKILNIHGNGRIETQEQLEERLLDLYFPERNQKNLIEILEGEKHQKELILEAYRAKNKEIGYREERFEVEAEII